MCFWAPSANRGNPFHTPSPSYLREPWESANAAPEGGKNGGERAAAAPQPLLLINHQKSLPWFVAFDPGSFFTLRGRESGQRERRGGSGEKGESQGPEGGEVRGERLGGVGPFALSDLKACLVLIQ